MTADPDPVWHMGPLPDPGPALTAEEAAEWAEYDAYVNQMQLRELDGRVEAETDWAVPAWPAARVPRQGAAAEASPEAGFRAPPDPEAEAEP